MGHITIPVPDFQFSDKIRERAKLFMDRQFSFKSFASFIYNGKGGVHNSMEKLKQEVLAFKNKSHQVVYIAYCFNYLLRTKEKLSNDQYLETSQVFLNIHVPKTKLLREMPGLIDEARFELYLFLDVIGYDIDPDHFSENEIKDIHSKINTIIDKLDELKFGQGIIAEDIEEIIEDLRRSKPDVLFGKKKFSRYMKGMSVDVLRTTGIDLAGTGVKELFISIFSDEGKGLIS